jgi:ABC-type ATPase with predicted acetyltransferase domain
MREHRLCEGCGDSRFGLDESYAATASAGDIEVAVWRCHGCGGLAEEETLAPEADVEPVIGARVA